MAPGISADPDDVEATVDTTSPKTVSPQSPPSTTFVPDERPSSSFTSIQETWEDMRDAVTDTDIYISAKEKATAISRTASSAWSLSKKIAWVVGTSALVIVLPLLYEIDKELGPGFDPAAPVSAPVSGADSSASAATPASASSAGTNTAPAATS